MPQPHLPRHREVAGLVDGVERPRDEAGEPGEGRRGEDEQRRAPGGHAPCGAA